MLFNVFSLKYFELNQWVGDHRRPTGDPGFITLFKKKIQKLENVNKYIMFAIYVNVNARILSV